MATSSEFLSSSAHQFPQPSRPLGAAENRSSDQYFDGFNDLQENRVWNHEHDDTQHILRGFVNELDEKGFEKFKKLVSKVEKKVPVKRLFKETLHDFKGRPASEMYEKFVGKLNSGEAKERDFDGEELKLERFKVKTVNVAGVGVVKEEQS